jgi:ribosome-binding protein aMBF1 (putative translation factor)
VKGLTTIWRVTMSDDLSLLEQFKQQHASFIAQRDQANINLQQLAGAIFACETMIQKYESEEAKNNMEVIDVIKDDEC